MSKSKQLCPGMQVAILCVVVLLLGLLAPQAESATNQTINVGGTAGWTNSANIDYQAFINNYTVYVGDRLEFVNPDSINHTVIQLVNKAAYDACEISTQTIVDAVFVYPGYSGWWLCKLPGTKYIVCGFPGHCLIGQKLNFICYSGTGNGGAPPPTPTSAPPPPPSTPTSTAPPPVTPTIPPTGPTPSSSTSNIGVIAGAAVGGGAALLLIGGLILFFVCRCRKPKDGGNNTPIFAVNNMEEGAVRPGPKAPEGSVRKQGAEVYSLRDVTAATQDLKTKIGEGGFGPVYYGKLADGQEVAVKVSDINSSQGAQEFYNEVDLLSRVHHRNLVSLVGYCQEDNRQMLIYEFLHKGTVREHLYGSSKATNEPLHWKMRLDIALNAALGLEYLHIGCSPSIIHRDIKSSNILLTNKYVAKVADFGLSKSAPEEGATHVSTVVKGTAGYLDPEYWSSNSLTEKSDVFSFGVVLLELICGRVPIDSTLPNRNHWNICDFVRSMLQVGDIEKILDPSVAACHPNMDSVWKVAEIAMRSVEPRGLHRPVMRDVVRELLDAITLECNQDGTTVHLQGSSTDMHGRQYSSHSDPPYSDVSETSSTFDSTLGLLQGR